MIWQEIPAISKDTSRWIGAAVLEEQPDLCPSTLGISSKGYGVTYKGKGEELERGV